MVLPMQPPGLDMPPEPMAPPDPLGFDPEMILQMGEQVRKAIEAQTELLTTPQYPPWYDKNDYPKPEPGKMLSKARQLEAEFAPLRSRIAADLKTARMDTSGVFRDFNPETEAAWKDTGIAGEIELIASQLADADLAFDAPARKRSEEAEAAKKIDFALACKDEAKRQHARAGNGPLQMDMARTLLLTGRLAWHCMLNQDADEDEMPFIEHLVDPASCMPVFEAHRGLRLMVRVYTTTVGEAIGAFSTKDNDLSVMLEDRARDGKFQKKRQEEEVCEVIEYWDRRWRAVFLDGKLILGPVAHDYGFVPFVYKLGGLGMPAYMRDPSTASIRDINGFSFAGAWHGRDAAMPHKGTSLVSLLRVPTELREAVMTRMLTAFDTSINPPLLVEMDDITYPGGVPEISRDKNMVSPVKMNRQKVQAVPTDPSPVVLGPILQGVADNNARMTLPPTAHGQNDKSNVAGYATNMLNEAGLTKTVPHKKTIQEFEQECMEMRFRLFRDWGHLVQQGAYGEPGTINVPRYDAMPDEDQTFDLTPGDLRRAGCRINVELAAIPIQMLGPLGNAVSIWMNLGLMDEVEALRLRQNVNPHKTLRRIKMNKMLNDPAIQELEVIEGLVEQGLEHYAEYFLARKMESKMAPPAMPGGTPGGMTGGNGPVQTTVGDSNAAYGAGPGPGSGPPPNPIGTEP